MTHVLSLKAVEADLVVAVLAERAVNEMAAGRDAQAHQALDLAEKVRAIS